jgi:AcrR family transcriptional regulator
VSAILGAPAARAVATVSGVPGEAPTPYAVAARDLLRTTVLDVVRDQLRTRGWGEIKMAEVARLAGVSRQTLYNEFGSRAGLAQAVVLREVDHFVDAVQDAVIAHRDEPVAALGAAFEVFLTAAAEDPLVRTLLGGEGADELLPLVTTQGEPVVERATARLSALLAEGWPGLDRRDVSLLTEAVVRLAISYAALPASPSGMDGDAIARLLGPFVDRALAGQPAR